MPKQCRRFDEAIATIVACLKREYQRRNDVSPDDFPEPISAAVLMAADPVALTMQTIERNPVGTALRATVRDIGWRLWASGGTALMRKACDDVRSEIVRLGLDDSRMMHTLDHWFDGVGRGATHVGTDPMRGVWFA